MPESSNVPMMFISLSPAVPVQSRSAVNSPLEMGHEPVNVMEPFEIVFPQLKSLKVITIDSIPVLSGVTTSSISPNPEMPPHSPATGRVGPSCFVPVKSHSSV